MNVNRRMGRRGIIICSVLLQFIFTISGYEGYLYLSGNFHAITAGEAYRSAQLEKSLFEYYVRKYNIRSILNLRGQHPDQQWYQDEINVSAALNIMHYDIPLSSKKEPSKQDVEQLIYLFKSAPRPVLIHCQAGADRSGLAAAMWKVIIDKESKSAAKKQLSVLYGHIPIAGTAAMDRFFDKWQLVN